MALVSAVSSEIHLEMLCCSDSSKILSSACRILQNSVIFEGSDTGLDLPDIRCCSCPLHRGGQMELEAVASVVMAKLKDMMSDDMTDKRVIEKALEEMKRVIADTHEDQRNSEEFKNWAEECLLSLYNVEDTVESFPLGMARQNKKWGFLMNHSLVLRNFTACQKLRRKMKRIPSGIKQVINKKPKGCSNGTHTYMGDQNDGAAEDGDIEDHNNEDSAESKVRLHSAMVQSSFSMIPEIDEEEQEVDDPPRLDLAEQTKLVDTNDPRRSISEKSLRDEVHDLVDRLTKTAEDGRALIVQLVGPMGSGKTTLARAVYGSRKIKNHFMSGCAWFTISKESNTSDVLQNLLKQNDKTWEELRTGFLDSQNRSTLLLITTDVNWMWYVSPPNYLHDVKSLGFLHKKKRLTEKYSWSLFLKKAGWDTREEGKEDQGLKQRILDVCYGLPLNTVLFGSLLSIKKGANCLDYLQQILNSQINWKREDIVSLSYADLPYHLKQCVLYLVLFPKEYDIPVRRLLRLWLSEGFVECKPDIPEDMVQENFDNLVKHSDIQVERKDSPAKEVGSLLSRIIGKGFGLLRVLDLEGVYKPSLPENLGDLFLLIYLGLRWTFLDSLPSSVGDLPYLETLDIPVKNGLDQLCHLRESGITFRLNNCEDLLNWISGLTSLQSLRLRSKNDVGHPSHFGGKLLSLSSLSKLSHLNLLRKLPKLPENLPQGLKVLTLSLSKLTEDPMPILGKLRQLNVLRLLSDSYMGKKMVCPQGGFEELRVLKLWNLKNLEEWNMEERGMEKLKNMEEWNVEERSMEKFKEINIRCCNKLMSIPSGLMKQRSLKELVITNMHEEFIQTIKKLTRNRDVILTHKDYIFTPLPVSFSLPTISLFLLGFASTLCAIASYLPRRAPSLP
ncbi:putative E3 ubiquitin-protein ligase UPL5-like [Capsicum annuum]|nr:putative E3 ubiquitin-protein ligase UPL5-like [Capsicum annuum]